MVFQCFAGAPTTCSFCLAGSLAARCGKQLENGKLTVLVAFQKGIKKFLVFLLLRFGAPFWQQNYFIVLPIRRYHIDVFVFGGLAGCKILQTP